MLDIVYVTPIENIGLVPFAIDELKRCTDVPFRVIAVIDGGTRADYADFESYLLGMEHTQIIHSPKRVYLNQCVLLGIGALQREFAALVTPETLIDDPKWFGKMQQVFLKDPHAFVCYGMPNTKDANAPPSRLPQPLKVTMRDEQDRPLRFALLLTRELRLLGVSTGKDEPVDFWAKSTFRRGGTVWCSPGVRYTITDHKVHETWRERSAGASASRSR